MLDAIPGVALGGILLANLMSFVGTDMMEVTTRRAMPWGGVGEGVLFAIDWLVEGKFYSIFSILLGTGFALQAARAKRRGTSPESFDRFFRRRMAVLIAIGLTHMYGLWSGDILTLYGIMGLTGSLLWRPTPRARVKFSADYLDDDLPKYFGTPLIDEYLSDARSIEAFELPGHEPGTVRWMKGHRRAETRHMLRSRHPAFRL